MPSYRCHCHSLLPRPPGTHGFGSGPFHSPREASQPVRRVAAALCCHQLVPKARSSRAFNQSGHPICALCFESGGGHWRECLCCAGVVTGWDTDRILSEVRDMHSCITWCNCTGESHGAVAWGNRMVQLRGAIAWGMAWCNCTVQHTVQYTGWDGYAPKVMTARLAAPAVRADGLVSRVCASWSKRLEAARAESVCTVRNRLKSCLGTVLALSWQRHSAPPSPPGSAPPSPPGSAPPSPPGSAPPSPPGVDTVGSGWDSTLLQRSARPGRAPMRG